jgi:hypothetical protein
MLWNNLKCLNHFNIKTLPMKVQGPNLDSENFDFIKILAQIKKQFQNFR